MLVESGLVRATDGEGREWTFRPSFGRIASLGDPKEVVRIFARLHEPNAAQHAAYVLAVLCDQEDCTALVGYVGDAGWVFGAMPEAEMVIIAQHLMRHGMVGKASPSKEGSGKYSDSFNAAEYISAARVHLGLSSADAEALSMTEFQTMFEMKFPSKDGPRERDVPSKEEYERLVKDLEGKPAP